ncbi:hypothetical protein J3F83DRAFT_747058 [Trichoderma novae-zelandiae]
MAVVLRLCVQWEYVLVCAQECGGTQGTVSVYCTDGIWTASSSDSLSSNTASIPEIEKSCHQRGQVSILLHEQTLPLQKMQYITHCVSP